MTEGSNAKEQRLGRYRLVRPLGQGGMGAVYLAQDEVLGREVAVKTIRPMALPKEARRLFHDRFMNEARAASALSHPNIVPIFDVGVDGDTPFLVMELVQGDSLKARLERGRLRADEVRSLGVQIARALDAAHARGIVHRDVKPANILMSGDGTWKLADFGIARMPDSELTLTGQFLGSPAYAAPEGIEGRSSLASDVWSLAATLYEGATGQAPYGGRGLVSRAAAASRGERPISPSQLNPEVPTDLGDAIVRGLAFEPASRPSAARLAEELAGVPRESPTPPAGGRATRAKLIVAGVVVLASIIAIAIVGSRSGPQGGQAGAGALPWVDPAAQATLDAPQDDGFVRSGKQEKRLRKAQERLRKGELRDAEEELLKILDQSPDDSYARALLDQVQTQLQRYGEKRKWDDE